MGSMGEMTEPSEAEIEAVARAICKEQGSDPDFPLSYDPGLLWQLFDPEARAAIAAYREAVADRPTTPPSGSAG